MTNSNLFSKRYNLRPTPEGLITEDVPESARVGICYSLYNYFDHLDKDKLVFNICIALRIPRITCEAYLSDYEDLFIPVEQIIMSCNWWNVYDICELIYKQMDAVEHNNQAQFFQNLINKLFVDEQLGFKMEAGKIEKVGSVFVNANIKEARILLKGKEFISADELFAKAIKGINERPKPDSENCIKDAVAAIESVARIIVNDPNAALDDIVKDAVKKGIIPQPLEQTIIKLHAYRGNEPAIAHGGIEPSKVTVDEGEFVLAMSAAMIIYLVKKRSKFV